MSNFKGIDKKELRALAAASTPVTAWYAHSTADSYGPEATIRGPFMRWFKCLPVEPQYAKHVSDAIDDVKFATAAMNNLVPLLDENEQLEKELHFARQVAIGYGKQIDAMDAEIARLKRLL